MWWKSLMEAPIPAKNTTARIKDQGCTAKLLMITGHLRSFIPHQKLYSCPHQSINHLILESLKMIYPNIRLASHWKIFHTPSLPTTLSWPCKSHYSTSHSYESNAWYKPTCSELHEPRAPVSTWPDVGCQVHAGVGTPRWVIVIHNVSHIQIFNYLMCLPFGSGNIRWYGGWMLTKKGRALKRPRFRWRSLAATNSLHIVEYMSLLLKYLIKLLDIPNMAYIDAQYMPYLVTAKSESHRNL